MSERHLQDQHASGRTSRRRPRVAVYCASSPGTLPLYAEAARAMGRAIAERGWGLVYGGGRAGLMGEVADAALAAGGEAVGVMPTHLVEREIAHEGLTQLHEVPGMHERKALMIELSDAYVALPGGVGTLEELAEVLSWARMKLHARPVGVLDTGGFYRPLEQLLDAMLEAGFLNADDRSLLIRAAEPAELLDALAARLSAIP